LYKVITKAVGELAKDDLIGRQAIAVDPSVDATLGYRQYRFRGNGGEYDLTLNIEIRLSERGINTRGDAT
jgi:hypothetical protein